MITLNQLLQWVKVAAPGDRLEYYRGLLVRDRSLEGSLDDRARIRLNHVANAARDAYGFGSVILFHKRQGPCDFSYFVERR